MLRRINEEFDTVDARDLPDWFIKHAQATEYGARG
jgi:hypothetical protein